MKYLSTSLFLICIAIANIAAWVGNEIAIKHIDDIVYYYHPLPDYVPKSREELFRQIHDEHIREYGSLYADTDEFKNYQSDPKYDSDDVRIIIALKELRNEAEFKSDHVEIYQESTELRVNNFFKGLKIIFALIFFLSLVCWLKTSPFSRLSGFLRLNSLSKKAKLLMLENEISSLRRMHAQGLLSDDVFDRKLIELQEKAARLLY